MTNRLYRFKLYIGSLLYGLACIIGVSDAGAQNSDNTIPTSVSTSRWNLGIEFQAYPTGLLPGLHAEVGFGQRHALGLRAGYNLTDHRELGVQDSERGGGPGFGVAYRYYFRNWWRGFLLGARCDIWFNEIDWTSDGPPRTSGMTRITVVQPTIEGGYRFDFGDGRWTVSPHAAFGFEVNTNQRGEDVGEGPIFLLGFRIGRSF